MKVSVINKKDITPLQEEILKRFIAFQQAIIDKDIKKLKETVSHDYTLTHMSERTQTKQEFIDEIMDGTLNYYKSTIDNPTMTVSDEKAIFGADITLDAKVYGMKGTWTLHSIQIMEKIDDEWRISKWDTMRM